MDMTPAEARIKELEDTLRDVRAHLSEITISTTLTALGRDHGKAHKTTALKLIDAALGEGRKP
jgi:hypothetical protein